MKQPLLTVQMCTYNRKVLLLKALEALFNQTLDNDLYEVVLVDDGSTDGTGEAVKGLQAPCAFTYLHQPNAGLSKGRNHGISKARGRYILFIDDDTIAHPELLEQHVMAHGMYPRHVIRGWVNHTDDVTRVERPRFTMADISTSFFWTSNVSVERSYLLEAGCFDEDFREYGWEDLELGIRLKRLGLRMFYNKHAIVYHVKTRWSSDDVPKLLRQAKSKARTAVIFLRKHPTWRVRLATGIDPVRIGLFRLASKVGRRMCEKIVDERPTPRLKGIPLWAARQLVSFTYFDMIEEALHES